MASSSTTRAGRLLSSAITRGTALGSTPKLPGFAAPGVAALPEGCFMGEGRSLAGETDGSASAAGKLPELFGCEEPGPRVPAESCAITAAAASARESGGALEAGAA